MKLLFLLLALFTFSFAGFFNAENNVTQKEQAENERLCKLFTEKAEKYQKTMRDDELAVKTLLSYKKRASLYCNKAK